MVLMLHHGPQSTRYAARGKRARLRLAAGSNSDRPPVLRHSLGVHPAFERPKRELDECTVRIRRSGFRIGLGNRPRHIEGIQRSQDQVVFALEYSR